MQLFMFLFVEIEYGCTRVVWVYKCFLCCMCLLSARPCVFKERIKEAIEKIRLNKQLPYLVGSVVEVRGGYWHVAELHSVRKYGSMSISNECDLAIVRLYGGLRHIPVCASTRSFVLLHAGWRLQMAGVGSRNRDFVKRSNTSFCACM